MKMATMALLVLGTVAFSQESHLQQQTQSKTGEVMITGTVASYEVAKSIEVTASGVSHKYDLNDSDTVYSISPEVAVGRTVTVTEVTGAEGHKTITISVSPPKS